MASFGRSSIKRACMMDTKNGSPPIPTTGTNPEFPVRSGFEPRFKYLCCKITGFVLIETGWS
jgi:hypothetical protein